MGVSFPNGSGTCNYLREKEKKIFKVFPDRQYFPDRQWGFRGFISQWFFFLTGNIFLTGNGGFISHRVAAARRSPRGLFPDRQYFPDRHWGFHFPPGDRRRRRPRRPPKDWERLATFPVPDSHRLTLSMFGQPSAFLALQTPKISGKSPSNSARRPKPLPWQDVCVFEFPGVAPVHLEVYVVK